MKKVKIIILFGLLILSMGCAGEDSLSGASDDISSETPGESGIFEPPYTSSLPEEPEPPFVDGGPLTELKWGFGSLDIPGAVRVPTEEYIQRYSCGNFLDEDTLIFSTNLMGGARLAMYEYKISDQTMRQVYDNMEKILGGSFASVARLSQTSLIVSTRDASMRFSLPDYSLISEVEPPIEIEDIFKSKTKEFDPLALQEDRLNTPEWGYGYYYDDGEVFIKFGHALHESEPVELEFLFAEEGKPPTVIKIPRERFPELPPKRDGGSLHEFDLRDAEYAPDKPYFVARVKIEGAFIGIPSATAFLVCNYETGEYYLSEFVHWNSSINIPVFSEDQSKVLLMADDFDNPSRNKAHISTFILDIEELLKYDRGEN